MTTTTTDKRGLHKQRNRRAGRRFQPVHPSALGRPWPGSDSQSQTAAAAVPASTTHTAKKVDASHTLPSWSKDIASPPPHYGNSDLDEADVDEPNANHPSTAAAASSTSTSASASVLRRRLKAVQPIQTTPPYTSSPSQLSYPQDESYAATTTKAAPSRTLLAALHGMTTHNGNASTYQYQHLLPDDEDDETGNINDDSVEYEHGSYDMDEYAGNHGIRAELSDAEEVELFSQIDANRFALSSEIERLQQLLSIPSTVTQFIDAVNAIAPKEEGEGEGSNDAVAERQELEQIEQTDGDDQSTIASSGSSSPAAAPCPSRCSYLRSFFGPPRVLRPGIQLLVDHGNVIWQRGKEYVLETRIVRMLRCGRRTARHAAHHVRNLSNAAVSHIRSLSSSTTSTAFYSFPPSPVSETANEDAGVGIPHPVASADSPTPSPLLVALLSRLSSQSALIALMQQDREELENAVQYLMNVVEELRYERELAAQAHSHSHQQQPPHIEEQETSQVMGGSEHHPIETDEGENKNDLSTSTTAVPASDSLAPPSHTHSEAKQSATAHNEDQTQTDEPLNSSIVSVDAPAPASTVTANVASPTSAVTSHSTVSTISSSSSSRSFLPPHFQSRLSDLHDENIELRALAGAQESQLTAQTNLIQHLNEEMIKMEQTIETLHHQIQQQANM